jgi:selenocysteine-specific elongation factor
MSFSPRILATAGHIDHGKSTLVEALTGINPDRLPEEKKRGMTIELGFAHLDLPDTQAEGGGWHIGMVDVPGHADFVRNMVAGVGSVDAALLVVAADDGWMPQTEEHFQILLHLGVAHGVVALTKSDLVTSPEEALAAVRAKLTDTPWQDAAIVPVCALEGTGLDALRTALCAMLRRTPPPADLGKPRLFVDRVFSPRGAGTVVTGTLTGGCLSSGDAVIIQPAGLPAKIRGLQNHGRTVDTARPGMRTAIQLAGVEIAHDGEGQGVWRGHAVEGGQLAGTPPSSVIHVQLRRLARDAANEAPVLRHGHAVWFHHGSAGVRARLYLVEGRTLAPGATALAELRFPSPVAVLAGDRFVLRDVSRRVTLAGGIVLEPAARARAWKRPRVLAGLLTRAAHPDNAAVWIAGVLERDGWLRPGGLLLRSRFSSGEITASLQELPAVSKGAWRFSSSGWQNALDHAALAVRRHHEAHPHETGLPLAAFRQAVAPHLPDAALADVLAEELIATGALVRDRSFLHTAQFQPALSPEVRRACLAIRGVLHADKENPPVLSSFVRTPLEQAALRVMVQRGEVMYLTPEIIMLTAGCDSLRQRILDVLTKQGRATVADIRDATGSTRRILVPLCERLDREGLTVRDGDFRRRA